MAVTVAGSVAISNIQSFHYLAHFHILQTLPVLALLENTFVASAHNLIFVY